MNNKIIHRVTMENKTINFISGISIFCNQSGLVVFSNIAYTGIPTTKENKKVTKILDRIISMVRKFNNQQNIINSIKGTRK